MIIIICHWDEHQDGCYWLSEAWNQNKVPNGNANETKRRKKKEVIHKRYLQMEMNDEL